MVKRVPYLRGKSRFDSLKPEPQLITLAQLSKLGVDEVTPEVLKQKKLIRSIVRPVKVTGTGEMTTSVKLTGIQVTVSAREKIEKAGGSIS